MVRVSIGVLLVVWTTLLYTHVTCEVYSSVAKLADMVKNIRRDDTLTKYIDTFITKLLFNEEDIENYALKLRDLSAGTRTPNFDHKNPLDAFEFVRNHTIVYNETVTQLLEAVDKAVGLTFDKRVLTKAEKAFPSHEDLIGMLEAVYRLQKVYDLDPSDVALGVLLGIETKSFTAAECMDMVQYSISHRNLYQARGWTELAIWLATSQNDQTTPLVDLYHQMAMVAFVAGEMEEAIVNMEKHLLLLPKTKSRRSRKLLRHFKFALDSDMHDNGEGWELRKKSKRTERFDSLCQGHVLKYADPARKAALSKLKCRFKKITDPYYRYQRIKLEELSRDPHLVLFHEAFNNRDLKLLQEMATPTLTRKNITGSAKKSRDDVMIGQTMNLDNKQRQKVRLLLQHIGALASLKPSLSSFESLQLTNYGYGGFYEEHSDLLPKAHFKNKKQKNQRIASFMIYMTDVETGGATVFPNIPEVVFPYKGNAVFWYNTYRNGEDDPRMVYAECPVAVGNKWVANQWIRNWGQELTRPCSKNKHI